MKQNSDLDLNQTHRNALEDLVVAAAHQHQSVLGQDNLVRLDLVIPEVAHQQEVDHLDLNDLKVAHRAQSDLKVDLRAQNDLKAAHQDLSTLKVNRRHQNDPKVDHLAQNVLGDLAVARMTQTLLVSLKSASEKSFLTQIQTMHHQSRYR